MMNNLNSLPLPEDNQIEVKIAPPGLRIGACALNILFSIIALIPLFATMVVLIIKNSEQFKGINENNPEAVFSALSSVFAHPVFLLSILVYLVYGIWQIVIMSKHGQSLGKRLLKIKVIKSNGDEAGFLGTVLLREVVYNIAVSIIVALLVMIVSVLVSETALELLSNLISWLPNLICLVMLFNVKRDRRTLQDYVADTVVVKLPD
ncbi:RDD family protein [Neisseria wadsworthii]|uniref:RDD family protein n=1 Tax=Neisseria wadsworthii TaxID=607711 RepID=UPI00131E3E5C|nr:RDD family protein [Neisseria wadsworthii]